MNPRLEKIVNKVAKDRGEDPDMVFEVIDTLFRNMAEAMNDYRYPEIRIPNFGALRARPTWVEDELAKVLEKLKIHKTPNHLYQKIVILNETSKRLRHERKLRKRKLRKNA